MTYTDRDALEASLNRRLPSVQQAVKRTGVSYVGEFKANKSHDFLEDGVNPKTRKKVAEIVERALGVYENDIVPEDVRRREEAEKWRREERDSAPLPRITEPDPLPSTAAAQAYREAKLNVIAPGNFISRVADIYRMGAGVGADQPTGTGPPAEGVAGSKPAAPSRPPVRQTEPALSLNALQKHPWWTVIIVAAAAFSAGFKFRDLVDEVVARREAARAATISTPQAPATSRPAAAPP